MNRLNRTNEIASKLSVVKPSTDLKNLVNLIDKRNKCYHTDGYQLDSYQIEWSWNVGVML